MQKKLQLFYIFKFSSSRLRDAKYQIPDLTLSQARRNGEVVSIGDSELLRLLRRMKGLAFPPFLDELKRKRQAIKARKDSIQNRLEIGKINDEIEALLFVPELIIIRFDNIAHYRAIASSGVTVNGRRFVRLMAGAGHTRRASVIFCDEEIAGELNTRLNNGRSEDLEMNMGKFGSYFALVSSATHAVSTPRFAVIPDYEFERQTKMDVLVESDVNGVDHQIVEQAGSYNKNAFDGQGLVSPHFAMRWANELGLDYTPSHWVFRGVFLKGGLVTFDMVEFAIQNNAFIVKDIWGKEHDIFNLDVILSASQFKMAGGYASFDDYLQNCQKNGFGWGISRFSPKKDQRFVRLNYQFIQVLDIQSQAEIDALCDPTLRWFEDVIGGDWHKTLLYLLGEKANSIPEDGWFDNLDVHTKMILIEPSFVREPVVQQMIISSLRRKMKDACLGKVLVEGNYQAMISDPVAQMEWALGLPVKGLLGSGQCYSAFWNGRGKDRISALRAPMTWRSEVNRLWVSETPDMLLRYAYIDSGIVFNIHDDSMARMSGADFDGDMCMTTDSPTFLNHAFGGNIVTYDRHVSSKELVSRGSAWESDVRSMTNRIGFITNVGTTYYSMLPRFAPGTPAYERLINRLKLLCCFQSMEIDKTKGIITLLFPVYWTKWSAVTDVSEDERRIAFDNNAILCDKRPYFFRHLYRRYDAAYRKHIETYENYCNAKFNISLAKLLESGGTTEHQKKVFANYHRYCPLVETDAPMNMLARKMEKGIAEIHRSTGDESILQSIIPEVADEDKVLAMNGLFNLYNALKKEAHISEQSTHYIIQEIKSRAEREISSSGQELLFLAIHTDVRFAMHIFADELIIYLLEIFGFPTIFPVLDDAGDIEYLGGRYRMMILTENKDEQKNHNQ